MKRHLKSLKSAEKSSRCLAAYRRAVLRLKTIDEANVYTKASVYIDGADLDVSIELLRELVLDLVKLDEAVDDVEGSG